MEELHRIRVNGKTFDVTVLERGRGKVTYVAGGRTFVAEFEEVVALPNQNPAQGIAASSQGSGAQRFGSPTRPAAGATKDQPGYTSVNAPMPGVVTAVLVKIGQTVEAGLPIVRIEAMKMENSILAPASGVVAELSIEQGAEVSDGQILVRLKLN